MSQEPHAITSVLAENRSFPPPAAFQARAHIRSLADYDALWRQSVEQPERFWGEQARSLLSWAKPFTRVLDWQPPFARWFDDGQLNVSVNCLDRHLTQGRRDKKAIIWEGEPGEIRTLTYGELHQQVCQAAHALSAQGVKVGDRITFYMPMCPELVVALLACVRLGAVHSVVFAGFSSEALTERIADAGATFVVTADGLYRRGETVMLKENVDKALERQTSVRRVFVVKRTGQAIPMQTGRDLWWDDIVAGQPKHHEAAAFPSEHPLFILYTSGSTGKPKGVLHSSAGYLLSAQLSTRLVFDLHEDDVYWCTADIGWVTGHSYVVYGPLANGATVFMYEGAPNFPDPSRFWRMIARHKISIFYTAPTAIRSFIKWGDHHISPHDLSSLRLLGSVGEPINPEAWVWYQQKIGGGRCPIVDTWWQTETGTIMIAPLPGATPTKPGTATRPFFGVAPQVVDKNGQAVPDNTGGFLLIEKPWPSMMRSIYGDEARYRETYWQRFPGRYLTGDGARRDHEGNYWIMGRIDDVLNVAGHRLSTMEIESALVSHPDVAEAAVVGRPDEIKGEAIVGFVTLAHGKTPSQDLKDHLRQHVVTQIGALARPEEIRFTDALPKTRSGKIMRRLLRDIARGQETKGDISTLEDFSVLARLRGDEE